MGKIEQLPVAEGPIPNSRNRKVRRRWLLALSAILGLVATLLVVAATVEVTIAELPDAETGVLNPVRLPHPRADLWGEAQWALREDADPHPGLVEIDEGMLRLGREAYYQETFGNEAFFSDILGIGSGSIRLSQVLNAVWELDGAATGNLQLRLQEAIDVGGRHFAAGSVIDTGLDVPAGAVLPLGLVTRYRSFGLKTGISCALCHSTIDDESGLVIEGAANQDLAIGLLLALAPNSAAFFTHTDIAEVVPGLAGTGWQDLPEAAAVERAVDEVLLAWPPGSFDTTIDMQANPTRFSHTFTAEAHPFGWSGIAQIGPFDGLSAFVNNLHGQNTDPLAQVTLSETLFGIGPERYLALILRGAQGRYRFDTGGEPSPSVHLAKADPTPRRPGLNTVLMPSTYPMVTPVAVDGVQLGIPGKRAWQVSNALSAFLDTLLPPAAQDPVSAELIAHGREVFDRAGCLDCHGGPAATDHRVVPLDRIGTEPSRARALAETRAIFSPQAQLIAFDQVVGEADQALRELSAPIDAAQADSIRRAFAHDGVGGYRSSALVAVPWQAPYLHDGGVAVGWDGGLGIPGTLQAGIPVDPASSLRALLDRGLRAQVIAANRADRVAWERLHVRGVGHEFWVDSGSGFDPRDQAALIAFLLARRYEPAAAEEAIDEPEAVPASAVARKRGPEADGG